LPRRNRARPDRRLRTSGPDRARPAVRWWDAPVPGLRPGGPPDRESGRRRLRSRRALGRRRRCHLSRLAPRGGGHGSGRPSTAPASDDRHRASRRRSPAEKNAHRVPHPAPMRREVSGFSLVEMLATLAVGSLLLLAAVSLIGRAGEGYDRGSGSVAAEREGRAALTRIAEDLATAVWHS